MHWKIPTRQAGLQFKYKSHLSCFSHSSAKKINSWVCGHLLGGGGMWFDVSAEEGCVWNLWKLNNFFPKSASALDFYKGPIMSDIFFLFPINCQVTCRDNICKDSLNLVKYYIQIHSSSEDQVHCMYQNTARAVSHVPLCCHSTLSTILSRSRNFLYNNLDAVEIT